MISFEVAVVGDKSFGRERRYGTTGSQASIVDHRTTDKMVGCRRGRSNDSSGIRSDVIGKGTIFETRNCETKGIDRPTILGLVGSKNSVFDNICRVGT